jgi:hypothetical protein
MTGCPETDKISLMIFEAFKSASVTGEPSVF